MSNTDGATFNDPLQNVPWPAAQQGWRAQFDGNGQVVGYIRNVPLDDSRGARQGEVGDNGGIVPGSDYAFEFVNADEWNGGAPAPGSVKYMTGGTNAKQNHNVPGWVKAGVAAVIGTALGGAALTSAGVIGGGAGAAAGGAGAGAGAGSGAGAGAGAGGGAASGLPSLKDVGTFLSGPGGKLVGTGVSAIIANSGQPSPPRLSTSNDGGNGGGSTGSGSAGSGIGTDELSRQFFDLGSEQWQWAKDLDAKRSPMYDEIIRNAMADSNTWRQRGDELWNTYTDLYLPLERRVVNDANTWDSAGRVEQRAGTAAATAAKTFDAAQGAFNRDLARGGVALSGGRALALGQDAATAKALGVGGAVNQERRSSELEGIGLRQSALQGGRNLANTAFNANQVSRLSGAQAVDTANSQAVTRNASLAPVITSFGGSLSATNAGNANRLAEKQIDNGVSQQNFANDYLLNRDRTSLWGNVIGAGLEWLSDPKAKKDIEAVDVGKVSEAIAGLPVATYRYKEGEQEKHVGPMADDWAKKVGGNGKTINVADAIGVALAAAAGNAKRIKKLEKQSA